MASTSGRSSRSTFTFTNSSFMTAAIVGVLERLVRHHVAPVARRVPDRQQDRLVLGAGPGERLLAPRVPVDRVVGVLAQVRAGLVGESVHSACTRAAALRLLPTVGRVGNRVAQGVENAVELGAVVRGTASPNSSAITFDRSRAGGDEAGAGPAGCDGEHGDATIGRVGASAATRPSSSSASTRPRDRARRDVRARCSGRASRCGPSVSVSSTRRRANDRPADAHALVDVPAEPSRRRRIACRRDRWARARSRGQP